MSSGYRGRHRHRGLRGPLTVLLALLALAGATLPGAYGGYLARITNNGNTAATATYFTCTAAQGGTTPTAYFTYPLSESSGFTATDISGSSDPGTYSTLLNSGLVGTGVTYGVPNNGSTAVCPRDKKTVIMLDGLTGFVAGPNVQAAAPNVFTMEIWFKTSAAQGRLFGYGNARNTQSTTFDRQLYVNSAGRLVFGVTSGGVRKTISSAAPVTDGAWHQAVATLSGAGMVLYVDGTQVAGDAGTTSGQSYNGYWRLGWDNLTGWPGAPLSSYFNGSLAFASAYTTALTSAQVAQHFVAGD